MARLRFSEEFIEPLAGLDKRVEESVWKKLALVQDFSEVGSSLVEPSLRHAYGSACLKVVAAGYDMLYERGEKGNDGEEAIDVLEL